MCQSQVITYITVQVRLAIDDAIIYREERMDDDTVTQKLIILLGNLTFYLFVV
jgi:hypothetical protein